LLGAYTKGKLRHYGYVGSGLSEKGLKDAVERMKPLFIDQCPSVNPPNLKANWPNKLFSAANRHELRENGRVFQEPRPTNHLSLSPSPPSPTLRALSYTAHEAGSDALEEHADDQNHRLGSLRHTLVRRETTQRVNGKGRHP
jgi:hypothetical protein